MEQGLFETLTGWSEVPSLRYWAPHWPTPSGSRLNCLQAWEAWGWGLLLTMLQRHMLPHSLWCLSWCRLRNVPNMSCQKTKSLWFLQSFCLISIFCIYSTNLWLHGDLKVNLAWGSVDNVQTSTICTVLPCHLAILPLPHARKCRNASVKEPRWGYTGPRNRQHWVNPLYWRDWFSSVLLLSVINGQHTFEIASEYLDTATHS